MSELERTASRGRGVDWAGVRRRLADAEAAVERIWTPPPEEASRILKERARRLAREPEEEEAGESVELAEFLLARETWGVETGFVREIHPLTELTPLPFTPEFVLGIVNLRGEILSIIDLRVFFDLPRKGLTDLDKVIVLESGRMTFGILADSILGVRRHALAEFQSSLPTLSGIREKYLKGVTGERLVVLDAEKLLSDDSIVVREQVAGIDSVAREMMMNGQ